MQSFTKLQGIAAALPRANVDTDLIIPKQFLKTVERKGLGVALFHELRTHTDGSINPDFMLNRAPWDRAVFLIAGANFGCGSSREHAPWALLDFGIRCVIAPSFADIFFNNCFKNGILPLVLPEAQVEKLLARAQGEEQGLVLEVDLTEQTLSLPKEILSVDHVRFDIEPFRRTCLLEGLDDIALTEKHSAAINAAESRLMKEQPWIFMPSEASLHTR